MLLLVAMVASVAIVLTILGIVYRKGQRDGKNALVVGQLINRRRCRRVKDMEEVKDKLRRGEF
ncbi:MAG: hypothetical protein LBU15_02415 [Rickettsiales bacterium]|jgi:hypothetical protein|nr:hypothetical protein [Rickettsiales bacterium]